MKRKVHMPTEIEDKAITRAAMSDPDNPPLGDDFFRKAKRGRPALPPELRKKPVTMNMDPDLIEALKATGKGWQTRANDILRKGMGLNHA